MLHMMRHTYCQMLLAGASKSKYETLLKPIKGHNDICFLVYWAVANFVRSFALNTIECRVAADYY